MLEEGRVKPNAKDVEEVVLGALLLEKEAFLQVADILTPGCFYDSRHRKIFQAILQLSNTNENIDILTVTNKVKEMGNLNTDLSPYFITSLTNRVASYANIQQHSMILKQYQLKRDIIEVSANMIDSAYDETADVTELMDYFITQAYNIGDVKSVGGNRTNLEIIRDLTKKIEYAEANKGITGVACGFDRIDKILGGYQPSDLVIKAGRPGMGKTAEALCEANYMANLAQDKKNVAFFSLEMSSLQLMQRLVSVNSEIPLEKLRDGNLSAEDWRQYSSSLGIVEDDNLKIYDKCFSLFSIIKTAKKLAIKGEVDIIYIDYLQLIDHTMKGLNREQTVSFISRSLKMLAKELNIPVIALSQLSRAVEQRGGDKKPLLSDLRESGSLEQDADVVQFIWRPEYYGITEDENGESYSGAAFVLTAKNRHGALKDTKLRFMGECVSFKNWEEGTEIEPNPDAYNAYAGMPISDEFSHVPTSSQDTKEDEEAPF